LLPDANQEPGSNKQQASGPTKEKIVYKDDIIKVTTRRSRRKKEGEPSAAENATSKTLENSTAENA
jgi:polyribonucleotide nucleotidyltransferase